LKKGARLLQLSTCSNAIEKVSVNLWKEELQYIVPRLPDLGEVKEFIERAISGSGKF